MVDCEFPFYPDFTFVFKNVQQLFNSFSSIHKVAIVNKGLINKLGRSLKIDQGIYVGGRLKSAGEKTDGVHIKESEVLANEIFFLDEYKRSVENIRFPVVCDLNLVKLLGFITSPISPGPIYKAFNISTHYKSK